MVNGSSSSLRMLITIRLKAIIFPCFDFLLKAIWIGATVKLLYQKLTRRDWRLSCSMIKLVTVLHTLFIAHLLIISVAESTTFTFTNKCNYTVWPGISSDSGAVLPTTGFSLLTNESKTISIPAPWYGGLWGRTYCTHNSTGNFSCITGDCGSGKLECSGRTRASPATLAEIALNSFGVDFFDVSIVDGFNLPLNVEPKDGTGQNCSSTGCVVDLNESCPSELRVTSTDGKIVGCTSPCDATRASFFCCDGAYYENCKPTLYSQFFKNACPQAYSYAHDRTGTFTCKNTTDYLITFCPGNRTLPRRNFASIIAGPIVGGVFIIFLLLILVLRIRRQSKSRKTDEDVEDHIKQVPGIPVRFSYDVLRIATNDFKEVLGRGGFGSVFKGVLSDGTGIAVKRLDRLGQEKSAFLAEVETIGSVHHFNLVRLIGFCAEKSQRFLIYEYMKNGSLDNWIFTKDRSSCLDWQTRKKIILDIAKGLAYLHEECRQTIIHLDIKPQNILLDPNFNDKISDFGLSKLIDRDIGQVEVSMRGTPGYLAPEWCRSLGRITLNVDTYSFGIVLLEVVSGRKNVDRSQPESAFHLLGMLQQKAEQDRLMDIVGTSDDESMANHMEEAIRMIKIGAWCLQDDPERRPSMSTVVKALEGVMEVDSDISYKFSHSLMKSSPVINDQKFSAPPPASVLSFPR